MKKETPGKALKRMIDVIKEKHPGMTQADIAKEIPCGDDYLSRMLTREKAGGKVPVTLLVKVEKRFELELTGKKAIYQDDDTTIKRLTEETIATRALLDVVVRELVAILAERKNTTGFEVERQLTKSSREEAERRIGQL